MRKICSDVSLLLGSLHQFCMTHEMRQVMAIMLQHQLAMALNDTFSNHEYCIDVAADDSDTDNSTAPML